MKTSTAPGFVNQILVYTLVMIGFSGSMGLGVVWMRHQISMTANTTKQLSARIAEVERHLTEATTAAEMERDPNILLQRNSEWRLGLVRPSETQIVHVSEDPVQRLAAKRNSGLFTDGAAAVSIPLALRR
jgi:hypothetical protein